MPPAWRTADITVTVEYQKGPGSLFIPNSPVIYLLDTFQTVGNFGRVTMESSEYNRRDWRLPTCLDGTVSLSN